MKSLIIRAFFLPNNNRFNDLFDSSGCDILLVDLVTIVIMEEVNMKYVIINHGFKGSNIENWFPYVKEKIDSDNLQVIIPQYPIDEKHHFYKYWKPILDNYKEYGYINGDTIMIGHSSGCMFTIKYLIENKIKIDKLILVSGFNNFFAKGEDTFHSAVNKSFYMSDEALLEIKKLSNSIFCIYGDNDPYIPQDKLNEFAKN